MSILENFLAKIRLRSSESNPFKFPLIAACNAFANSSSFSVENDVEINSAFESFNSFNLKK